MISEDGRRGVIPGLASLLFRELVLVVAGVLVVSLVVAMTVTPFLSDRLGVGRGSGGGWMEAATDAMARSYRGLLRWLLSRPCGAWGPSSSRAPTTGGSWSR